MAFGMRSLSTLLKKIGWFYLIAYLLCFSLFSAQMYKLVQKLVFPTNTHTFVKEVPLKDMDFPLDVKICVNPSMNRTALKAYGYGTPVDYIAGSSFEKNLASNSSMISWGGLSGNNTSWANAREVFNAVKLNLTEGILKEMVLMINNYDDILFWPGPISMDQMFQINRLHACHILSLDHPHLKSNEEHFRGIKSLTFSFNEMTHNSFVKLKLQGRGLILHRDQQQLQFDFSGDNVELVPKKMSRYVVEIKKRVFVEEDSSQTCRNYPTSEFDSYTECDDDYARKKIEQFAPGLNLTPVWMTDNLELVTSQILSADQRIPSKIRSYHNISKMVDFFDSLIQT